MNTRLFQCDGFIMLMMTDDDGKILAKLYFSGDDGGEATSCDEANLSPGAKEFFDAQL